MVEVTKHRVTETAREEAERALAQAERRAEGARVELGNIVFDVADDYFPEAARARRRRFAAVGFAAGFAVGLGLGFLSGYVQRE